MTVTFVAVVALNFTPVLVVPQKFVPVMTTVAPIAPLVGENDRMVGAAAAAAVKLAALVPLPSASITTNCAVPVEPAGTAAVNCVSLTPVSVV